MAATALPLLALDFGGTKNSAAIIGRGETKWRDLKRAFSPPDPDAAYDYATLVSLARELLQGVTPAAIGVSFGGPVRASSGTVILSHHVRGWENVPLRENLEREFSAPVAVDNDANVAALGEWRFGAGAMPAPASPYPPEGTVLEDATTERGCASMLYVTVSTGVGGGWILDGKIYRGAQELAGELGHLVIDPQGPLCGCGRRGCIESLASGPSIARMAREVLMQAPPRGRTLRALVQNDLSRVTAQLVNQAALDGDELARAVINAAARALGFGIGGALVLMNPARVVIGGGVSKSGEHYFETVRAAARANVTPELREHVDIVPAALGDDAPLWGAVALTEELIKDNG